MPAAALATLRPAHAAEKLVTVTGEATVAVAPDIAVIRIGVASQGKTAREASDANARQMTAVLAAIKDARHRRPRRPDLAAVAAAAIRSEQDAAPPRLLGFQVTNQLTVKIRDIDKLPAILDRAIGAGANEMSGIEFVVSEQSKLLDQARDEAIADARRKAELYAKRRRREGRPGRDDRRKRARRHRRARWQALRAGAAIPIAPGEQMLRAVVTVSLRVNALIGLALRPP